MYEELIRSTLAQHGHLKVDAMSFGSADDLYAVGLTSHATVNVMLALEDEIGIEFPERLLRKATFATIDSIDASLTGLTGEASGATT